jgi:hypothetical protein
MLVTCPMWTQRISDYITKVYEWSEDFTPAIQTVEVPEGTGTADALRALKGKIKVFYFLRLKI